MIYVSAGVLEGLESKLDRIERYGSGVLHCQSIRLESKLDRIEREISNSIPPKVTG